MTIDSFDPRDRVAEMLLRQDPPRDPLTGRLLSDLTPRALAAVLERYPFLRALAPKPRDPNKRLPWDVPSYFNGARVASPEDAEREMVRSAGLLADPARSRTPTKPATYTL